MLSENQTLPLNVVKLLLGFCIKNINEEERDLLDEWICESESNMKLFGECLEVTLRS